MYHSLFGNSLIEVSGFFFCLFFAIMKTVTSVLVHVSLLIVLFLWEKYSRSGNVKSEKMDLKF